MAICRYCKIIHEKDPGYRVRQAAWDLKSGFPRCSWHWQFVCDECGKIVSFNGMSWCPKTKKFFCIRCARQHKKIKRSFWAWDYYYALWCKDCNQYHPVLDRLEYTGKHPWQLDKKTFHALKGLSRRKHNKPWVFARRAGNRLKYPSQKEIQKRWDKGAEIWDGGYTKYGDAYRRNIFNPALFPLLGNVKGKKILDAGCGTGYLCRLLAEKGAHVTGVDLSKKFIEICRRYEKNKPLGIEYFQADLARVPALKTSFFDMIVSVYVLCDVRDHDKAVKEMARVLKPSGRFVFLIEHPCFSWSGGGWKHVPADSNRTEDWLYYKVDNYFQRRTEETQWGKLPRLLSFYRPLSDYFHSLKKHGFVVVDLNEPQPLARALQRRPRDWDSENRVPPVLIIDAKKEKPH
jgi:ubiquinone/menaquinone biosynthesis C-methylase UbiE